MRCTAGVLARVEEGLGAGAQRLKRIARSGERRRGDLFDELLLDAFVDGLEELLLAREVVIERSSRDARGANDLLGPDRRVAALGKQRARRRDERGARGLTLLGLQRSRRCRCRGARFARLLPPGRGLVPRFDMHAVCMIDTY